MPRRAAVGRSITSVVCRPLSCWSVLTSAISGSWDKARRTRGSHSRRSASSSACSVNWYCAFDCRPPMRMSCTGTRKRFAPGSCASLGRRRAITWSTLAFRSLTGFSVMNMKPELRWPPPVKPTTFSTAGSPRTISAKSESFWRIAWNEHHEARMRERPGKARLVAAQHRGKGALAREKQAPGLALARSFQQPRAHHRRGGERDEQRHEDRDRERHRELAEQAPDDAAHEEDRDEHRDQGEAHREHGEAHLARAFERRLERRHALLDVARDVLQHHDRVVHDEAGGDGERHQR